MKLDGHAPSEERWRSFLWFVLSQREFDRAAVDRDVELKLVIVEKQRAR